MLSKKITSTDAFMDMPLSSQALYLHLLMGADDEGFVNNPKKIVRMVGCQEDDYKILMAKRFILGFDNGVVVIKHWLIHNTIRMDRFSPTVYIEEKAKLSIKENKSYTENTNWQPNGNHLATQVKLSKVKLDTAEAKASDSKNKSMYEEPSITLDGDGEEIPVPPTPKKYNNSARYYRLANYYMELTGKTGKHIRHYPALKEIIAICKKQYPDDTEEKTEEEVRLRIKLANKHYKSINCEGWGLGKVAENWDLITTKWK